MLLKRITINKFGEIENKTFEFTSGINVLYHENQSEKNRIYNFLEGMFYGEPGENCGEDNSGIIWFENEGKNYRLTRNFSENSKNYELFCEEDQTVLNGKAGSLEFILGGMSKAVYDNTVVISAPRGKSEGELSREIQNYMCSVQETADSSMDLGRAGQMLKMWRKGYYTQKERFSREVQKEKEKISTRMEKLETELEEIKDGQAENQNRDAAGNNPEKKDAAIALIDERIRKIQSKNLGMIIAAVFALVVGMIGLFGRFQVADEMSRIGMDICILGAVAAGIYTLTARRRLRTEFARLRKQKARMQVQHDKFQTSQENLKESYKEMKTEFLNLQREYQEYEGESSLPTTEDIEIQGLNLAMDRIECISREIQRQTGRKIRIRASRILENITEGKYKDIILDSEHQVMVGTVNDGEEFDVKLDQLDKNIILQVYFALQMAVGEVLERNAGICFPVILDDVFELYGENEIINDMKWPRQQQRQVIISTEKTSRIMSFTDVFFSNK